MQRIRQAGSLLFFLSALLLLAETAMGTCAKDPNNAVSPALSGNKPAASCAHRYLVSIRHPAFNTHSCAGTLISGRFILSAASCLSELSRPKACVDHYYLDDCDSDAVVIEQVVVHPRYVRGTVAFDVAIGRLAKSISAPRTVALADGRDRPKKGPPTTPPPTRGRVVGAAVTVAGWGRVRPQGQHSAVMQEGRYQISSGSCPSATLCAGKANTNICEGDHGGPLLLSGTNIQVGVASKAVGDCSGQSEVGRFADVASVKKWIQQNTRNA